jgi:ankyrin repeat protein
MTSTPSADPSSAFIEAACVPRNASHASGTLEQAEAMLQREPEIATHDIHTAAILGDDVTVREILARDPAESTAKRGPYDWDALTHLCFSRYLRLDRARSDGFVRAATALLDAGASANTGFYEMDHQPRPEWEPVLYGAAGIAHHPELTRLLLERGANPTDNEVVYHTPESYDNRALKLLVESGKLSATDLALMLVRKHDWHDYEGAKWLLEHGAPPNLPWNERNGWQPTHHALARDNSLEMIELLLDHGADFTVVQHGRSGISLAARRGRSDVLDLFARRRVAVTLQGVDRLIAACARNDTNEMRAIAEREPALVAQLRAEGGKLLAEFAGNGNTAGVRQLLDLGVNVDARFAEGDGYWDVAPNSTALHVAAWRARHDTVRLLIERGAPVDAVDAKGRTPLVLAVRACVDSYWTNRRSPESVAALLDAGAATAGIRYPSGYADVDELLKRYGASS